MFTLDSSDHTSDYNFIDIKAMCLFKKKPSKIPTTIMLMYFDWNGIKVLVKRLTL